MEGRGGQRKPRRGRGSYGRARGQGAGTGTPPSPSASPSTAVTSPPPISPEVPAVSQQIEKPSQLSSTSDSSPEKLPSPHAEVGSGQEQLETEEQAQKDPIFTRPSHQFEKSVRVHESPVVLFKVESPAGEQSVSTSSMSETPGKSTESPASIKIEKAEAMISPTTTKSPNISAQPVVGTPKMETPKEVSNPRVLVVEPKPPRQRKRSDPPTEIELPASAPPKSQFIPEIESSPSKDLSTAGSSLTYSYGLGGPLGKPGYITHVSGSISDDDPWDDGKRRSRRPSKIAEVTAAAKGFSRRQWITLLVFGLADLFSAMLISIQAPFYPAEAERKGATATEYGLVFGVFELVVFVMSPIYGKYMNKIGPKLVYNLGIFTTGISCILFGLLDRINDHTMFIAFSFIIRICEAIGNAAFVTAGFTIIACEFPESVATTFASLETFYGLGLIVGPTIGGALFQVGGYMLPFIFTGVVVLITAIFASIIMPKIEIHTNADGKCAEGYGILKILKIPGVALAAISIFMGANSIGFLSATLEPHLRQFVLTPLQIGLVFIINGGVYALTAPGFGWLCDKSSQPKYIMLIGAALTFVSFLLIGPAPFIPLQTTLWMTSVGLLIHGLAVGAILVSGFILALRDCLDHGFPDNISTYGVVSGLWTSMLSLGAFVGPSIGGVLLDNVGFQTGSLYILAGEAFVMVLVFFFILYDKPKPKHGDTEAQPLLSSSPIPGTSKGAQPKWSYGTAGESDA